MTTAYKAPKGGWFEKMNISCPHYLAEIVVHISIGLVLRSVTWYTLTAYVTTHHLYLAYNTQTLYRAKFDDYPKNRKIILPFLL